MTRVEVRSKQARLPPRPRLRRRPGADRPALLHQLGGAALRPGRAAGERGLRRSTCRRSSRRARWRKDSGERETAILAGGCFWGMEELLREHPRRASRPRSATPAARSPDADLRGRQARRRPATPRRCEVDLRPAADLATRQLLALLLPHARPDHAEPPGQRHRHASTARRSSPPTTSSGAIAEQVKARGRRVGQVEAPDRHRDRRRPADFWPAEEYHQDYLDKNPGGYTCHYLRD